MNAGLAFADVEQAFIRAALDPSRWNDVMDTVAAATRGVGALMFPSKMGSLKVIPSSPSLGDANEYYFRHGWQQADFRYRGLDLLNTRGVFVDQDLITADEMNQHPYYQEFLARFGLKWSAVTRIGTADDFWSLAIQRRDVDDPFSQTEQRKVARWGLRLSNVALLARHLNHARALGAFDLLENLGCAAILLNSHGMVVRVNQRAEALSCGEFKILHLRMVLGNADARDQVETAIRLLTDRQSGVRAHGAIVVPRQDKRPLILHLVYTGQHDISPISADHIIVLVHELESRSRTKTETLRQAFGLTPAEAELASILSSGECLAEAADALRIASQTARTRLKSIFDKTSTNRQGALVALLARLGDPLS